MWTSDMTGDLAEGRSIDHWPSFAPLAQLRLLSPQQTRLEASRMGIILANVAGLTSAGSTAILLPNA
jgi:hypothetical protein